MTRAIPATTRRAGFTLIELMVVIAIIAILVSLTAAAIFKISGQGDILIARKDISDLALAVNNYKTYFKVDWLPSRFRLRENIADYVTGINNGDQLDSESYAYLKKLFPKIASNAQIDWNGNGVLDAAVDLEGHQCLVFFLGGIPSYTPNGVTGFSTVPSNPATPGGERIGPFYSDFRSDRLVIVPTVTTVPPLPNPNPPTTSPNFGYFSYLDPWGVNPYAYFSTYKKTNGYNRYFCYYQNMNFGQVSDCPSLTVELRGTATGLWPYAQSGGVSLQSPIAVYQNKDSFQIICAGPDKVFGQGTPMTYTCTATGIWTPLVGSTWTPQTASNQTPKGNDDLANFHDKRLGSGD